MTVKYGDLPWLKNIPKQIPVSGELRSKPSDL